MRERSRARSPKPKENLKVAMFMVWTHKHCFSLKFVKCSNGNGKRRKRRCTGFNRLRRLPYEGNKNEKKKKKRREATGEAGRAKQWWGPPACYELGKAM